MMEEKEILISIVIPVKNGDIWLDACIKGIMSQTLFQISEIIILESGSTDNTLQILSEYPVKIISIPPAEFNHGLTRNVGVQFARGKYVVMTVQDARPFDQYWLENLLKGFSATKNVAGVCGQQVVPHEKDKNPAEWFRPMAEPSMKVFQFSAVKEFEQLSPSEKKDCCGWDDVTAMYDRNILKKIPFKKVTFGEDALWAQDVLKEGYAIVYNNAAKVYHYHNEDKAYTFKRSLSSMYLRYKQHGFIDTKPHTSIIDVLRLMKVIWQSEPLTLLEKWQWLIYNLKLKSAFKSAYNAFICAVNQGDDQLEILYEKYCGKPPVPIKNIRK